MSQDGKKPKLLSTRRIPKTKNIQSTSKDSKQVVNNTNLDSFLTLSSKSDEGIKDDSLFNLGSSLNDNFSTEREDVFQFPNESKTTIVGNIDSETIANNSDDTKGSGQNISLNDSSVFFQQPSICENNPIPLNGEDHDCVEHELDKVITIPMKSESVKCDVEKSSEESADSKKQCPVCVKLFASDKYVNHMKSCAAKNNLSTQKLLDALKLQQKQQLERKELGLDVPVQSFRAKGSPRRQRAHERKGAVDANLQLAIALSASLHSAEEQELIEEAEVLNAAGLKEEAQEKLSTLERFGFASLQPPQSSAGTSKSQPAAPTLLLKRTQEERDRIVTEKVAIVLISEEENDSLEPLNYREQTLNSKILKREWDKDNLLWKKAQRLDLEERSLFYVSDLSEFVSVAEAVVEMNVQTSEDISELVTPPRLNRDQSFNSTMNSTPCIANLNTLGNSWRTMVNNYEMSDVEVICKNGENIPSHKLVLYVRCPKVLNVIMKSKKGKEEINFKEFSFSSTLAFLDFSYSGSVERIKSLSSEDFTELCCIVERFDFNDLRQLLNSFEQSMRKTVVKQKLRLDTFPDCTQLPEMNPNKSLDSKEPSLEHSPQLGLVNNSTTEECGFVSYGECKERSKSPDMFDELKGRESATQSELDCLVSLIGKTSNTGEKILDSFGSQECDSYLSNTTLRKRKASTCSISEEEETSMTKKHRSNGSKNILSEDCDKNDEVYDLTQSSASNGENVLKVDSEEIEFKHVMESPNRSSNDFVNDLTQRSPSTGIEKTQEESPCSNKSVQNESHSVGHDYIDPIWDYDDYFYSNYSPANSPKNSEIETSNCNNNSDTHKLRQSPNVSKIKQSVKIDISDKSPSKVDKYSLSSDSDLEYEFSQNYLNTPDIQYLKNQTAIKNNSSSKVLDTSVENSPKNIDLNLKLDEKDNQPNSQLERNSLAKRLLNDSFEINNSAFESLDILVGSANQTDFTQPPLQCEITAQCTDAVVTTPTPKLMISDNITPLPNYSAMKTPALKKELSKFGLKPGLGKRKAKLLLRYIYDETHPLVPDSQHASESESKSCKSSTETMEKRTDSDSEEMSSSQRSVSSSGSGSTDLFGEISNETQEPSTSGTTEDLKAVIRNLIVKDSEFHHRILMYEPIYIEDLMNRLKLNGTKANIKTVMDYLDEQCITFRTNSWKATNQKRRQNMSRKKKKIEKD